MRLKYLLKPILASFILALFFSLSAAEETPFFGEINAKDINLRSDATITSTVISTLDKGEHFLLCLTLPFTGWSLDEYKGHVTEFCNTRRDKKFDSLYRDLFYRPMVELIDYLSAAGFSVYIVSGSEQALVRAACSPVLGLAPSRYIGTLLSLDLLYTEKGLRFIRQANSLEPSNVGDGKPMNIHYQIGKPPVLAVGNTTGDLGMLTMATTNPKYRNTLGIGPGWPCARQRSR